MWAAGRPVGRLVVGSRSEQPPICTTSELFDVLWATLSDVIGPTATAALLVRCVKRAVASQPELRELVIAREQFVYTYTLPASWTQAEAAPRPAFSRLMAELWPLLSELTGPVVLRRLHQVPLLRRCGVIPQDVKQ